MTGMLIERGSGLLLRHANQRALDATLELYRTGVVPEFTTMAGAGKNGTLYRGYVADAAGTAKAMVVQKSTASGGAADEFAFGLARELESEHMLPMTAQRSDGTTLSEFLEGRSFTWEGIRTTSDLERELTTANLRTRLDPDMTLVGTSARHERQLMGYLEYLLADHDRERNTILDIKRGPMYIDFEMAGFGDQVPNGSVLRPGVRGLQDISVDGYVHLDPAVRAHIAEKLTVDEIAQLHAASFFPDGRATPTMPGRISSDAFMRGVQVRHQRAVRDGYYGVHMLGNSIGAAPLRAVDDVPHVRPMWAARTGGPAMSPFGMN